MAGITIDFRSDLKDVLRSLGQIREDQIPFLTAYALTKTAQDIKAAEIRVMEGVFDRPTRFTLNSLFVKPATKKELEAVVHFKEGFGSVPAWRYLGPQVEGGPRKKKSHERALERANILRGDEFCVPGKGVNLDSFGNMKGGEITRILSRLSASPDPLQNVTARSARRNKRRGAAAYFVARGQGRLPDGIYQRVGLRNVKPVLIFVRQPRYHKRFPFYEQARQVYAARFAFHMRDGFTKFVANRVKRAA